MFPKLFELIDYLDSLESRADLVILERLLTETDITRADISSACIFGAKTYRRNRISESPWYELLALCWRSGQRSPIHDHAHSSCGFRVIEGMVTETRFVRTASGLICPTDTRRCQRGFVACMQDADIHQVSNLEAPDADLVTLHIYSPPLRRMKRYSLDSPAVDLFEEVTEPLIHGAGI